MKKVKFVYPYSVYIGLKYGSNNSNIPIHPQGFSSWVTKILFTEYSKLMKWGGKNE